MVILSLLVNSPYFGEIPYISNKILYVKKHHCQDVSTIALAKARSLVLTFSVRESILDIRIRSLYQSVTSKNDPRAEKVNYL